MFVLAGHFDLEKPPHQKRMKTKQDDRQPPRDPRGILAGPLRLLMKDPPGDQRAGHHSSLFLVRGGARSEEQRPAPRRPQPKRRGADRAASPDGFGTESAIWTISSPLRGGMPVPKPALIASRNRFAIRHCPIVPGWNPSARNRCRGSLLALTQSISMPPMIYGRAPVTSARSPLISTITTRRPWLATMSWRRSLGTRSCSNRRRPPHR